MEESKLTAQLNRAGFSRVYAWEDGPHTRYPDHTHPTKIAHIILHGEMTLSMQSETKTYRTGERCDVPAGTVHSDPIGLQGCRYLIGER